MKYVSRLALLLALSPLVAHAQETSSPKEAAPQQQAQPPANDTPSNWDGENSNAVVAIIDEKVITFDELRRETAPLVPRIADEATSLEDFQKRIVDVYREVLKNMVDRILIIKDFRTKGHKVPKYYLDNEFNDFITTEFNGDRAAFLNYLQSQNKTIRQFRQDLEEKLVVGYMRNQMRRNQAEISPERIAQYYTENKNHFYQDEGVRLRQIMLAPYANESAELLLQEADRIVKGLKEDASFADLARRYSQDEKRRTGGDWGWINRKDIRKELGDVAFKLNAGEFSEPILLDKHVFILFVEEKRDSGIQPLDKVRDQIEFTLSGNLARESQEKWLERLRRKAYIRLFL